MQIQFFLVNRKINRISNGYAFYFFLQYGDREASSLSQALYPIIPRFFDGIEVVPSLLHGDLWGGNAAQISDSPGMLLASTSKACSKHHVSRLHITGRARLIRSHSSARFSFELSGNSN